MGSAAASRGRWRSAARRWWWPVARKARCTTPSPSSAGSALDAIAVPTDITSHDGIGGLVGAALGEFGAIDCWVNNAGSANASDVGPLIDLTESQWDAVVDLNLKWTFFAAQAAAREMVGRGGSIVNISSRSGSQPCPMTGQYGAAKAGVESLTATMAVEWGHHGIRVNAVAPGLVPTEDSLAPGGTLSKPSRIARQVSTVPLRRLGTPDDIGAACAFLASDESAWITGRDDPDHRRQPDPGRLPHLHAPHHDAARGRARGARADDADGG